MERSRFLSITGRLIGPFIPRHIRDGRPEQVLRARVLVALLLFNGALSMLLAPVNVGVQAVLPGVAPPWPWILSGLTLLAFAAALLVFRRTGRQDLAGNIYVVFLYAVVAGFAAGAGPQTDRVLQWLLLVPIMAFLMMGLRWGLVWTAAAMAGSALLHMRAPPDPHAAALQIYWNWLSLLLVVVLGLFIYESVTRRLLDLLDRERGRFAHAADHDALTRLPNRAAFDRELGRAVAEATARGRPLALAYLDLDGFKPVNDTHGHAAGDVVLRLIARRLSRFFRSGDIVARVGGDEFAIVLHRAEPPPPLDERFAAVLARVAEPIVWKGRRLRVTASIGVAVLPANGRTAAELLAAADAAMYRAKRSRGCVVLAEAAS